MGIASLNQILRDAGQTIAVAKLAMQHLERTGRKLRVAIDIAIWMFQIRSASGGFSPEIRTLFYRLIRLMSVAIDPIFVFDGPNKPKVKRNKQSARGESGKAATAQAKRIIRLFGYISHDAPGEAEAECALLQRRGIVDAVISQDVDTIMFGCNHTLRFARKSSSAGQASHFVAYHIKSIHEKYGLDREGMILVALMGGGDYDDGIPGCGAKAAHDAARAGFGKAICSLKSSDKEGIRKWRERLQHELRTNESGFFSQKRGTLTIPDNFPNMEVLRYYTHPVVSSDEVIQRLAGIPDSDWSKPILMSEMRHMTEEFFDWCYLGGAKKLLRVITPAILTQKLIQLSQDLRHLNFASDERAEAEALLVKNIKSRREHQSNDELPELRIEVIPLDVTGLDVSDETEEEIVTTRDGLATNSDNEFDFEPDAPTRISKDFNPAAPVLHWVPETIVRLGAPLTANEFDAAALRKAKKARAKSINKRTSSIRSATPQLGPADSLKQSSITSFVEGSLRKQWTIDALSSPTKPVSQAPTQRSKTINAVSPNKSSRLLNSSNKKKPLNPWDAAGAKVMPVQVKSAHEAISPVKGTTEKKVTMSQPFFNNDDKDKDNGLFVVDDTHIRDAQDRVSRPQSPVSPTKSQKNSQLKLDFLDDLDEADQALFSMSQRTGPKLPVRPHTPEPPKIPARSQLTEFIFLGSSPEPITQPAKKSKPVKSCLSPITNSKRLSGISGKRTSSSQFPPEKKVTKPINAPSKKQTVTTPASWATDFDIFGSSPPFVEGNYSAGAGRPKDVKEKMPDLTAGGSKENAWVLSDSEGEVDENDVVGCDMTIDVPDVVDGSTVFESVWDL